MQIYDFIKQNEDIIKIIVKNGITIDFNIYRNMNIYLKIESFLLQGKNLQWACFELEKETGITETQIFRIYKRMKSEIQS